MLKNIKIATKFNLLLMLVFIGGVLISGVALSRVLEQRAEDEVISKATILIETINSVRDYTQEHVNPLLVPRLKTESAFIPEAIPTFAAREVFEKFRTNEEYKDFFFKDAATNPTNLVDKADSFETQLVEYFRSQPQTQEVTGFRNLPAGKVFYIARPFVIKEQACLECHSTPAIAPKSQLATYGTKNGFGWKLNDIVAAQFVSVPADKVFESAQRSLSLVMGILIGIFALVILLINFLLKRAVIQPIKQMAKTAQAVSTGYLNSDFEQKSNDEIGVLAVAFNRMKSSLEIAMQFIEQKNN